VNSIWVDLLGAEVRYRGNAYRTRTIESGSGDLLIMIHGVGGHAEAYSRNIVRLGRNLHAMSIDLLWHGYSGKPPFTTEMIPAYCKQIVDLLDSLGVEKTSIEGESLGGWVAIWFALHYPERLDKLILNTAAGIRFASSVKIDHATGTNLLRERSIAAIQNPSKDTIRKRLEWLMATPDRVTDELVDLRYAIYTNPETKASLTDVFNNSFQGDTAKHAIDESELAKIKAPTLALWSDHNPGAGPDAGERLASCIPGAQFYCINDAAHWPQWEHPEEHDRVVTGFLAGEQVGPVLGLAQAR
jgi:pimeloyl-ACP methyl ester carboxylesterase